MLRLSKPDIVAELQKKILCMQGQNFSKNNALNLALGPMKESFPNASFPLGTVHEFLSERKEQHASTSGFIAGLLSLIMSDSGAAIWISRSRTLFPPALKHFGIEPERFIFLDVKNEKDVVWAMEESLKCNALAAVVGEIRQIDFTATRRLQLAVEQSKATGFVIRNDTAQINASAFVSRWKISPLQSEAEDFPGIGFPKWKVELLRMRNGKSNSWNLIWADGRFMHLHSSLTEKQVPILQAV